MARAVADDCLAPAFVKAHPAAAGDFPDPLVRAAVKKAATLLSRKHAMVMLDSVWGFHGQSESVKKICKRINLIVKEFISSDDIAEAERGIRELGVPHFHHHLVYEAIYAALDSNGSHRVTKSIAGLLAYLARSAIVTPDQLKIALERLYEGLPDLTLDIPFAPALLQQFVSEAMHCEQYLSPSMLESIPTRSPRRRFVSENEGGRVRTR
jgi:programmed cell death protein 4